MRSGTWGTRCRRAIAFAQDKRGPPRSVPSWRPGATTRGRLPSRRGGGGWAPPRGIPAAGDTQSPAAGGLQLSGFAQAVASFGISVTAMLVALVYMPAASWVRAFLALGLLYVVTSTVVLCKVVRDRQEMSEVTNRVDQARRTNS
ncbi:YiaA/YiaB family inner membrane protein [Kribbella sp. VKM Ac-2566]|uniref:YiaA/YiaB family inner membrane protein n=1 Tax=Kribbella sp. VKM Ac-2566 TaxID=2512218 RepID=UPI0035168C60